MHPVRRAMYTRMIGGTRSNDIKSSKVWYAVHKHMLLCHMVRRANAAKWHTVVGSSVPRPMRGRWCCQLPLRLVIPPRLDTLVPTGLSKIRESLVKLALGWGLSRPLNLLECRPDCIIVSLFSCLSVHRQLRAVEIYLSPTRLLDFHAAFDSVLLILLRSWEQLDPTNSDPLNPADPSPWCPRRQSTSNRHHHLIFSEGLKSTPNYSPIPSVGSFNSYDSANLACCALSACTVSHELSINIAKHH